MMVDAEREKPGQSERHWKSPMPSASRGVISSSVTQEGRYLRRSTTIIMMAPATQRQQHRGGVKRYFLMVECRSSPTMQAGRQVRMSRMMPAHAGKAHIGLRPQQPPEAFPVQHHHGHDGAELDDDIEGRGLFAHEVEQVAGQDEMAR